MSDVTKICYIMSIFVGGQCYGKKIPTFLALSYFSSYHYCDITQLRYMTLPLFNLHPWAIEETLTMRAGALVIMMGNNNSVNKKWPK